MSKKNFKTGFDSLLGGEEIRAKQVTINTRTTRATFIVPMHELEMIKAIAFWKRTMIKDVLAEALSEYINKYESENGPIIIPK